MYDVDRGAWSNVNPSARRAFTAMAGTQGRYSVGTVYAVGGSRGGNQSSTSAGEERALHCRGIWRGLDSGPSSDVICPRHALVLRQCAQMAPSVVVNGDCLFVLGGSNWPAERCA